MKFKGWLLGCACAAALACAPAVAHADPISAAVVTAIGLTGTAATVATFVVSSALRLAGIAAISKLTGAGRKAVAQERQASVISLSLGETPREALFGRVCTAGSLVDAFNYGGSYGTDWECLVIALADHKIDALEGFFVNDVYYPYTGDGGQPAFSNYLDIEFINGSMDPEADASRFTTAGGWSSGDRLKGVSHVYFSYKFDEKTWPQGRPSFKFLVRGKRCYDPRLDSTVPGGSGPHRWATPSTWEWSENAQICRYNWVRGVYAGDQVGAPQHLLVGRGLSALEAPPERIFAAANLCDEAVALKAGGTEPRYRVSAIVRADESFDTTEEMFAAAMAGVVVQREGGVEIEPGQSKSAVIEITDADLVVGEKVAFDRFLADTQRINTVVPTYVEPAQGWSDHAAPVRRSITDINTDGGTREEALALSFVTSGTQAQRCGEIQRRMNRLERRATIVLGPRFSGLEEGDWIGWTSDRFHGGARVVYRVEVWSRAESWRRTLALREVAASAFSWTAASDEYTPGAAVPDEPGLPAALALAGVTITPVGLASTDGLTIVPAVQAIWTAPVDPAVRGIRLEIRLQGEAEVAATNAADVNSGVMVTTNGIAADALLEARLVPIGDGGRDVVPSSWVAFTAGSFAFDTFGTEDGFLDVYYQTSAPTGAALGDIWFDTDAGNAPFQLTTTGWEDASNNAAVQAIQAATAAQSTANSKVKVFYQTSAPTATTVGDLWVDTDDATRRVFRWSGSTWQQIADQTGFNIAMGFTGQGALATLSTVNWATLVTGVGKPEDYANKSLVYKQTSAPTGAVNDVWIRTDGSGNGLDMWVWNGSAWISGADRTPFNIAMGITAQGPWATASVPTGLTPTTLNGRTQYLDTAGQMFDYRGLYWGYSIGVAAGRDASPLSSDVGAASCAAHTVKLYRASYSTGYPISISAHTASGLADDTAYTWFYRPDYGDHFCVYAGYAPAYVASPDGYMLIGDIKTPASSGYYVPPGGTTPDPSTSFEGNYDAYRCVAVSSFLASGQVAGEAKAGDALTLMAPAGDRVLDGVIEAMATGESDCLTFATAMGAVLTVSVSTPIMTRRGSGFMPRAVRASEAAVGLAVPILTEAGDLAWDEVTAITPAGRQMVAQISARGIGVFAASDHPTGPRLFTHNMWNKVPA
jgi:hypothetical protein